MTAACWQVAHRPTEPGRGSRGSGIATDSTEFTERKAIWPRTARNTRRKPVWYSVPSVLSVAELFPCLSVARHEKRSGHGLRGIPGENPFGTPCHPCFPWPNSFRVFPWLATKSDLATDCAEYPEKTRLVLRAIRAFRGRTLSVSFRGSPRKAIWPRTARNTRRKPVWYSVPSVLSVAELFPCLSVARHEKRFGHGLRGIPGENPFGTPCCPCFPWPNSFRVFPWLVSIRTVRGLSWTGMFTSEAVTRGIKVRVESEYAPERSQPSQNQWFFLYTITILNEGTEPAQLLTRHWVITDGTGHV